MRKKERIKNQLTNLIIHYNFFLTVKNHGNYPKKKEELQKLTLIDSPLSFRNRCLDYRKCYRCSVDQPFQQQW